MRIHIPMQATAAKAPSDKALKKAKEVLTAAQKAKADGIRTKLQEALTTALELDKESGESFKVYEAQIAKLHGQIARLESKRDSAHLKTSTKISKLIPKITKLQDEYHLLGGKDLVPASLAPYFEKATPAEEQPKTKKKTKRPSK